MALSVYYKLLVWGITLGSIWARTDRHWKSHVAQDITRFGNFERKLNSDIEFISEYLQRFNEQLREWNHKIALADFTYRTNITDYNQEQQNELGKDFNAWLNERLVEVRKFNQAVLPEDLRRQMKIIGYMSTSTDTKLTSAYSYLSSKMEKIYGTAKVCSHSICYSLEPDVVERMAKSRNPTELKFLWKRWRDAAGPPIRGYFRDFVEVQNAMAKEAGYHDYSQYWKESLFYDTDQLEEMADKLWEEIKPFYQHLHAYVRRKLREYYPSDVVPDDGTIPAHLLGNMWAQHWPNIIDIVYPVSSVNDRSSIDTRLKAKYNVTGMFVEAQEFFTSIGFFNMTKTFWEKSMLVKPEDREVVCHASASDLFYSDDFRIKMCSDVSFDYFKTIHHEMGHVEYFMAYKDQPTVFRAGANKAFHEAVGDTIQLSALSADNLRRLGLKDVGGYKSTWDREKREEESTLYNLMQQALEKVAFLPFGLLVDKWRWDVMRGKVKDTEYNKKWWERRLEYQGISAPVPRSEHDFDPGAKYHISSNSPYIGYFFSYLQQFQMFKAMCDKSGFDGPLHECNFFGSMAAGDILKRTLSAGSSRPWQELLQEMTGSDHVTTEAINEYFKPLIQWLQEDNTRHGEDIGWPRARVNMK